MAKKGSKGPTRPCVNSKCKKPVHPRAKTCPHCGKAQPQKTAKPKKARGKKAATKKTAATGFDSALEFVDKSGGLDAAEAALGELRKIKEKLG